jgi:hypothetical protein
MTRGASGTPASAAVGGALGWAALLAADAARGPVGSVAESLGSVMQVPGVAIVAATLLFPAALAWAAATVAGAASRAVGGRTSARRAGGD